MMPPPQADLEADYRRQLQARYGIVFNQLLTLVNMPIKRFGSMLLSKGEFHDYLELLRQSHSADNLTGVMCRSLLSLDWQGYAYDCDFNQMLDLPVEIGLDRARARKAATADPLGRFEDLDLSYSSEVKYYEAPFQVKANTGMLLVDDFGRQKMSTDELLNRWIVPLEKRYDFLNLASGKKIQVPFDQLIIFSTNLEPNDLCDDAFLRRIPYKVEVIDPDEDIRVCQRAYLHPKGSCGADPTRTLSPTNPRISES